MHKVWCHEGQAQLGNHAVCLHHSAPHLSLVCFTQANQSNQLQHPNHFSAFSSALHRSSQVGCAVRPLQRSTLHPATQLSRTSVFKTASRPQHNNRSRANMQICTAGYHLPPAVECELQRVQGRTVIYVCLMLGIVSLALFEILEAQIAAAVAPEIMLSNPGIVVSPLDAQPLYDTANLVKTLTAWGCEGRVAFAAYELSFGSVFCSVQWPLPGWL